MILCAILRNEAPRAGYWASQIAPYVRGGVVVLHECSDNTAQLIAEHLPQVQRINWPGDEYHESAMRQCALDYSRKYWPGEHRILILDGDEIPLPLTFQALLHLPLNVGQAIWSPWLMVYGRRDQIAPDLMEWKQVVWSDLGGDYPDMAAHCERFPRPWNGSPTDYRTGGIVGQPNSPEGAVDGHILGGILHLRLLDPSQHELRSNYWRYYERLHPRISQSAPGGPMVEPQLVPLPRHLMPTGWMEAPLDVDYRWRAETLKRMPDQSMI